MGTSPGRVPASGAVLPVSRHVPPGLLPLPIAHSAHLSAQREARGKNSASPNDGVEPPPWPQVGIMSNHPHFWELQSAG